MYMYLKSQHAYFKVFKPTILFISRFISVPSMADNLSGR